MLYTFRTITTQVYTIANYSYLQLILPLNFEYKMAMHIEKDGWIAYHSNKIGENKVLIFTKEIKRRKQ